jgi:peptide chain release factor 2
MRAELIAPLVELGSRIEGMRGYLHIEDKQKQLSQLQDQTAEPGLWNDREAAQKLMQKISTVEGHINKYNALLSRLEDVKTLSEMADEENDEEAIAESLEMIKELGKDVERAEMANMLSEEYDFGNAIVSLHPGAGGTESNDWAQMLFRMYTRWAERSGFEIEIADYQPGDEAGLKSSTVFIKGDNAFGYMKSEKGVHRLVRISPFDASARRHTSFVSVDVLPEIEDASVEINPEDLKIDTFRSGGAGGQHVNKTESAIRITHLPTGIIVQCQNERSQYNNKEVAMRILKSKLIQKQREDQEKKLAEMRGDHMDIAWGSQIRSYVFQPYTMVKDHRTGCETGDINSVMDGGLDEFIEAYLRMKVASAHKV